jgi:hypothetical protein
MRAEDDEESSRDLTRRLVLTRSDSVLSYESSSEEEDGVKVKSHRRMSDVSLQYMEEASMEASLWEGSTEGEGGGDATKALAEGYPLTEIRPSGRMGRRYTSVSESELGGT